MKRNMIRQAVFVLIPLVLLSVVSCRTPGGRSAGNVVDDGAITTKVKSKIFEDQALKGFGISVETYEGEVTLTGGVDTPESKTRATEIARSVDGVRRVNNLLKVRSSQTGRRPHPAEPFGVRPSD